MNFLLTFDSTGDSIPFDVIANQDLFEFFVDTTNTSSVNAFKLSNRIATELLDKVNAVKHNISKTNEVFPHLTGVSFNSTAQSDYLDQRLLNKIHADWVNTQSISVNIDTLMASSDPAIASIGQQLHHQTPDDIRTLYIADALTKLGYVHPYEEINMSIHRLEALLNFNMEYSSAEKWRIFDNPFANTMETNNGGANFNFGYTYLGRQTYDKFVHFDGLDGDQLNTDFWNFETLEFSFNLNLKPPESIPFSKEFIQWCDAHNTKPIGLQVPIANVVDLDKNLLSYRKILYNNISNSASINII